MRMSKHIMPQFSDALERLYPRYTSARAWRDEEEEGDQRAIVGHEDLPKLLKYLLLTSYIASANPPKSDLRMFGRGLDEKKRKRRAAKTTRSKKATGIPSEYLGPSTFSLDRLVAILGALLEDNDEDRELPDELLDSAPGEFTDMEISRVWVQQSVRDMIIYLNGLLTYF